MMIMAVRIAWRWPFPLSMRVPIHPTAAFLLMTTNSDDDAASSSSSKDYGDNEDAWSYKEWVRDVPVNTYEWNHKLVPIVWPQKRRQR